MVVMASAADVAGVEESGPRRIQEEGYRDSYKARRNQHKATSAAPKRQKVHSAGLVPQETWTTCWLTDEKVREECTVSRRRAHPESQQRPTIPMGGDTPCFVPSDILQ